MLALAILLEGLWDLLKILWRMSYKLSIRIVHYLKRVERVEQNVIRYGILKFYDDALMEHT
ncbi:hypothetical protein KAW50_05795 [candidate division WOR-3 bacterium]|nr:hypothetical protein [candidate division WOR-3 bacterium]